MSRGLGRMQLDLLAALPADGTASVLDLCEQIHGGPVPESMYSSARRAMRGLVRRGLVVELPIRYRVEWLDARPSAQKHYAHPAKGAREMQRMREFFAKQAEELAASR